jgi:hypothetical protein
MLLSLINIFNFLKHKKYKGGVKKVKKDNVKCIQSFKNKKVEERKKEFNKKWVGIIEQVNRKGHSVNYDKQ